MELELSKVNSLIFTLGISCLLAICFLAIFLIAFLMIKKISKRQKTKKYSPVIAKEKSLQTERLIKKTWTW